MATYLSHDRGILLELKRMNRILEIDPKNMHAVVEPFVTVYQLIDAASKQGFYVGKPGVGYSAAVISLACCHQEMTISQLFTSGYGRNVLGAEWVLPTGEILNLGTANREGGWFSGDGPGFSLRGILRGRAGANGGHGVITKCAVKLYPWNAPAPTEYELVREPGEAISAAQIEKVPDTYRVHVLTFPDTEKMMRAAHGHRSRRDRLHRRPRLSQHRLSSKRATMRTGPRCRPLPPTRSRSRERCPCSSPATRPGSSNTGRKP